MAETNTTESREALLLAKWEATAKRYDELTHQLTEPSVLSQQDQVRKLNKERSDLEETAHLFAEYQALLTHLNDAEQMLKDSGVTVIDFPDEIPQALLAKIKQLS